MTNLIENERRHPAPIKPTLLAQMTHCVLHDGSVRQRGNVLHLEVRRDLPMAPLHVSARLS